MYYLYVVIITLLLPLECCRLFFKSLRHPALRSRLAGTLSSHSIKPISKPVIWIHAVSVGEVQACRPLIGKLWDDHPDHELLVSTVTTTGAELVRKSFESCVTHTYLPYDHPFIVQQFLNAINPAILVVAETEIWPVLYKQCKLRHIPVIIINARVTDKSFHRYQKLRSLTSQTLGQVNAIVAQSEANAEKFNELVIDKQIVSVNKNLKFDVADITSSDEIQRELSPLINGRCVIIAASTHSGEETLLLDAFNKIKQSLVEIFIIIVPRHPERAKDIGKIARDAGFNGTYYTDKQSWKTDCNVLIVDEIGILQQLYLLAELVVIGGSFVPIGGHNMLEPASASKAIITGPYLDNFIEIYELLETAGGIVKVKDQIELISSIQELLKDQARREDMGARARGVVIDNRGGVDKIIRLIDGLLPDENQY